jgi:hypothetical protein
MQSPQTDTPISIQKQVMHFIYRISFKRISDEMHRELTKLGTYGDSMDDIIRKLVDFYKKEFIKKEKVERK